MICFVDTGSLKHTWSNMIFDYNMIDFSGSLSLWLIRKYMLN